MGMRFDISSSGSLAGSIGFGLRGPFALPKPGQLPVARLTFTRTMGTQATSATLLSTGREAFLVIDGQTYRLPPEQTDQLRAPAGQQAEGNPLASLRIDDWMQHQKVSDGGRIGGVETTLVSGNLDVVNAFNDLLDMAGQLGATQLAAAPRFQGDSAESLQRAIRSATMSVYTGRSDHLLRKLLMEVRFGVNPPPELHSVAGQLGGAKLVFEFDVTDPNRPVHVSAPRGALPASALPGA
jgi:hypothetical protein